jgi:hypothetical protein
MIDFVNKTDNKGENDFSRPSTLKALTPTNKIFLQQLGFKVISHGVTIGYWKNSPLRRKHS